MPDGWGPGGPADQPLLGDRVVVRYRVGPGVSATGRPLRTDVTGTAVEVDASGIAVTTAAGGKHGAGTTRVAAADIESVRVLSAWTVRNSDIRSLELAAARAWPGAEHAEIDGWFLRAGHGFSRRGNSATPVRHGAALASARDAIAAWYRERGFETELAESTTKPEVRFAESRIRPVPLLAVPDRLLAENGLAPGGAPTETLVGTTAGVLAALPEQLFDVRVEPAPDRAWLAAHSTSRGGTSREDVLAACVGEVGFAAVHDGASAIGIGRGAVTEDASGRRLLSVSALYTAPHVRRRGVAGAVLAELAEWGRGRTTPAAEDRAYDLHLAVELGNLPARRWYRTLGLVRHHTASYQRLPAR